MGIRPRTRKTPREVEPSQSERRLVKVPGEVWEPLVQIAKQNGMAVWEVVTEVLRGFVWSRGVPAGTCRPIVPQGEVVIPPEGSTAKGPMVEVPGSVTVRNMPATPNMDQLIEQMNDTTLAEVRRMKKDEELF